jgi:plastocyanin
MKAFIKTKLISRHRKIFLMFLAIVVLICIYLFVFVFSKKQSEAKVAEIHITASGFQPSSINITPGTKIIWTNNDKAIHQVASNPYPGDNDLPGMKSEILNNGQTFEYTFTKEGSFSYHDDLNPTTNANVEVRD